MILYRGAEAILHDKGSSIIKERVKKGYRIAEIDEALRKKRTKTEARLLREAARAGIDVPQVLEEKEFSLTIEKINGERIKEILDKNLQLSEAIGESIAKLHGFDIIHGDLTTSNMLLRDGKVFFIDFGLGLFSKRAEDKANDLYLLHEALESAHFRAMKKAWEMILKAYRKNYAGAEKVLGTFKKIEKRRRYK